MERKANVDEGGESLDATFMLSMIKEELLAALIREMPFKNVKWCRFWILTSF